MQLAEDLVQEVFLILWEKGDNVKTESLKSLLYTIANNLYIDHYRHKKLELNLLHHNKSDGTTESPEYLMELKEFDRQMQRAIAGLSDKERTVFLMNRIDKCIYKDIAESLNISIKAVEKRMHNALEKLYKNLNYKI
jgi:RNA polymerase sigma factor (sigma-70 family)